MATALVMLGVMITTLEELYRGFEKEQLVPLSTEIGDLMPVSPRSAASPTGGGGSSCGCWPRRRRAVSVGRGGERRAIALANPGLGGRPFATPTLWAAIQYLMPGEDAPEHRHTQHAFRFVVEGEGVWTVVNGDPVAMRRGDFLPQAGWNWHAHHNATAEPMAWLDGLDIPFQYLTEAQFFEPGRDQVSEAERSTPCLTGHARSASGGTRGCGRWRPTGSRARRARRCWRTGGSTRTGRWPTSSLSRPRATAARSSPGTRPSGSTSPATGADVLPTIRAEMHRIARGARTAPARESGSSVYLVFDGSGTVTVGDRSWTVTRADLFVVPSWQAFAARSEAGTSDSDSGALDLFRFSDAPVFEALQLNRAQVESAP